MISSLAVIAVLVLVHVTIGRWRFLDTGGHSPWLSVSAGTALAYVFVYLLPKLAETQEKLSKLVSHYWHPVLESQIYLIALAGLVCFFWLAAADDRLRADGSAALRPGHRLWLHIGGYGFYSLQVGLLVAELPRPGPLSYSLTALVLGTHLMGVDHGVRHGDPNTYDRLLRWVFAAALLLGWAIGIATLGLEPLFMLTSAFIGGGIIITAVRDELPGSHEAHFLPFFLGVVGASAAILSVQILQGRTGY